MIDNDGKVLTCDVGVSCLFVLWRQPRTIIAYLYTYRTD
jgi:hypothetical protein